MTQEIVVERGDRQFSVPRGSLRRGRLEFTRGAARLTVRGEGIPELFRARFDRPAPSVSVHEGAVTVRYRGSRSAAGGGRGRAVAGR